MKWREMLSNLIFEYPKWPADAIADPELKYPIWSSIDVGQNLKTKRPTAAICTKLATNVCTFEPPPYCIPDTFLSCPIADYNRKHNPTEYRYPGTM